MFGRQPGDNSGANRKRSTSTRNGSFCWSACFPVGSNSSDGEMEETNDHARAADKCRRENGGDSEKKCDFGDKISACFVAEVFATDVEERRLRTAGGTAVIAIKREGLKIAIGNRKPGSGSPSTKIPTSPAVVSFGAWFHRLLTFLL